MNKKIVHDALILTTFTLVLGLILAVVYGITKAPIDAANLEAKQEAYKAVFDDAASFETQEYDEDAANSMVSEAGYNDTINDVESALDANGETLGYVITVTAKDGSQGSITFSVGIQNDGTVNGYSITDISETPGLGMKAEEVLKPQFAEKNVGQFTYTKTGAMASDEIDAISGATITTNALVNGVNAGLECFKNELGGGVNE